MKVKSVQVAGASFSEAGAELSGFKISAERFCLEQRNKISCLSFKKRESRHSLSSIHPESRNGEWYSACPPLEIKHCFFWKRGKSNSVRMAFDFMHLSAWAADAWDQTRTLPWSAPASAPASPAVHYDLCGLSPLVRAGFVRQSRRKTELTIDLKLVSRWLSGLLLLKDRVGCARLE